MFTGIVEEIGIIKGFTRNSHGAEIIIQCKKVLEDSKIGDSIAINGCCQTVTKFTQDSFAADVSDETLKVTNFSFLKSGDKVNLERALTPSKRMGGHIVQGHVDCVCKFISKVRLDNFYNLTFELSNDFEKYVVKKGSITLNGISLTVAEIINKRFKVAIIPHTFENTTLYALNDGDFVNLETDILGKYVEKFLSIDNNRIDENFLLENGFI